MRRFVLVFVAACGGAAPAPVVAQKCPPAPTVSVAPTPPSAEGRFTGVLAGKLHLALTLRRGGYSGVLDSIDQGAKLPIENVTIDGATLRFEIPMVKGAFEGKLDATGKHIEGTWTQLGVGQPLALERSEAPPESSKEPPPKPLDAPIDVEVAAAPVAFRSMDHTHLAYELHVSNYAHRPITLAKVEVLAGARSLATLEGDALANATDSGANVAPRSIATVFVWVTTEGALPAALDQRITVKVGDDEMTVSNRAPIRAMKLPSIGAPLRGRFWLAANGPSNSSSHRRALLPIAGHAHIAQRFAIDWVKPGDDGKTFTGDATKNASYHAYGAEALAVDGGTVVETKDGIAENVPGPTRAVPITLETIGGNHVVIDLGGGVFAFYAHLQPGSLKVKTGDHVRRGQVLGLVGNSGNSTEPHLHFQLQDAPSPLASEGIPYGMDFELRDGTKRKNQLPAEKELVALP